jgi:hypothetical protein
MAPRFRSRATQAGCGGERDGARCARHRRSSKKDGLQDATEISASMPATGRCCSTDGLLIAKAEHFASACGSDRPVLVHRTLEKAFECACRARPVTTRFGIEALVLDKTGTITGGKPACESNHRNERSHRCADSETGGRARSHERASARAAIVAGAEAKGIELARRDRLRVGGQCGADERAPP